MYATMTMNEDNHTHNPIQRLRKERSRGVVPYCIILDDTYRVIMAGPSTINNPLAGLYGSDSRADSLPAAIEVVVRALTSSWRSTMSAESASATIQNMHVTVAPVHGFEGRRIAVFVRRLRSRIRS